MVLLLMGYWQHAQDVSTLRMDEKSAGPADGVEVHPLQPRLDPQECREAAHLPALQIPVLGSAAPAQEGPSDPITPAVAPRPAAPTRPAFPRRQAVRLARQVRDGPVPQPADPR